MNRRLFTLWRPRPSMEPAASPLRFDADGDADDPRQAGWHQSSHDLRTGLSVLESDDDTSDFGADTRPSAYYNEGALA